MLDVYADFAINDAAIPVIKGIKSESEKFAGAKMSSSIEAMMGDKRALQSGTSHFFGENFAKSKLYSVETHTTLEGYDKAVVSLHGKRRVAINPVYPIISKIFSIGETYTVEAEINLVKEDGQWKVCDDIRTLFNT